MHTARAAATGTNGTCDGAGACGTDVVGVQGYLTPTPLEGSHVVIGLLVVAAGLTLNLSTYWALGLAGTHYGSQLGRQQAWIDSFPFNLVPHPQYVGVTAFIWGIYLALAPDWHIIGSRWAVTPFAITLLYGLSCTVLENGAPLLSRRSWSMSGEEEAEDEGRQGLRGRRKVITFVSDAWEPQVNGVVRTVRTVAEEMRNLDYDVQMVTPDPAIFYTVPMPMYSEIRLCINFWRVSSLLEKARPDGVHIFTEGPLGLAARFYCQAHGIPFTTALTTRFPEYIHMRCRLFPVSLGYAVLRWFHAPARATLIANADMMRELTEMWGFRNTRLWTRGVDLDLFHPGRRDAGAFAGLVRPIMLYVGRVAMEKNVEALLQLRQAGTKVIVGDGPARETLQQLYPDAVFLGSKHGEDLARCYASADVVVFPSLTDTFGLVVLEAMASGVPVAAFPVTGPLQTIDATSGACDADLDKAVRACLQIVGPEMPRKRAELFSWGRCAQMLEDHMHIEGKGMAA